MDVTIGGDFWLLLFYCFLMGKTRACLKANERVSTQRGKEKEGN
jgi:hypothetical protein